MKYNRIFALLFTFILLSVGCNHSDKPNDSLSIEKGEPDMVKTYAGIPSTACQVAENEYFIIFLNDEALEDSIEGLPTIKQVSLWKFDKKMEVGKKILLTHPHADGSWFTMDHSVVVPLDYISTISEVTILSWEGQPLRLLAEGCSDYRNVQSFILDDNCDEAICLPTNRGLIGVSEEEGFLIMQSYGYYEDGGRYNIIDAFDVNGNRVSSMSVMR